jgi:AraC family transcriptional regulator, regulatory protein of adaptative response / methylated-DNA-[protein]-cysteine methyltransferase
MLSPSVRETVVPASVNEDEMTWKTEAQRWQAVVGRDAAADGAFFFAVKTTGVFCRPSCRSRQALRKNVEFFDSAASAARAGYRACLRCKPDAAAHDAHADALVHACRLLERDEAPPMTAIAASVKLSVFHFHRLFKRRLGVTPGAYRRGVLAERARSSLAKGVRVSDAIYDAGYSSSSRFYEGVGQQLGMTPSTASAGASGEHIDYTFLDCALGRLLLGWTSKGVCHLSFDDDDRVLKDRFPRATMRRVSTSPWATPVKAALEGGPADVPLDVRGTAFQVRVWDALRRIPTGETRSYTQIAKAIGAPGSARAVATACASNSIAVVVPCHRVVREGGALAGYRWGVDRKRALLKREAARR